MAALTDSPFAILSFFAAPAVMTNASSVLVLSTSNRFARAVDRARVLASQLSSAGAEQDPLSEMRLQQLEIIERRVRMLLKAMTRFYLAVGGFASASLISILGAGVLAGEHSVGQIASLGISLACGIVAIGSLVWGCMLLVRETRLAVQGLNAESRIIRDRLRNAQHKLPPPMV